ncbi:hypothetical protein ElyMa_001848400 [Elysia marginata]|uniref:Uncharacterized protein n=1 Tax=Elysia marginata TaxID=1093978 RepID=A0AAV4EL85_9GAST|nr:hypothetical protein ElyMa_001848400 [Elysia marginata]
MCECGDTAETLNTFFKTACYTKKKEKKFVSLLQSRHTELSNKLFGQSLIELKTKIHLHPFLRNISTGSKKLLAAPPSLSIFTNYTYFSCWATIGQSSKVNYYTVRMCVTLPVVGKKSKELSQTRPSFKLICAACETASDTHSTDVITEKKLINLAKVAYRVP